MPSPASEVRTALGKPYLLAAIDCTSQFAFVEVQKKATQRMAPNFLNALIQRVPYQIHTVLTDNGVHFITPGNRRSAGAEIDGHSNLALEFGSTMHLRDLVCNADFS